jgi:hypothetical protein
MDGAPVINKRRKTCPLKVSLASGREVTSTHMCDVKISGLPATLTGHIIPELSVASLFGICVLTAAGCKVRFDNLKCTVWYNNRIILQGGKDQATDLWTLPIGNMGMTYRHDTIVIPPVAPVLANTHAHYATTQIAFFMHTIRNKANSIRFSHQLLCSPRILTLIKAIKRGYLKGCPNLTAKGISKYLNPSPATAKGHMRRPHQGIRSTRNRTNNSTPLPIKPDAPDVNRVRAPLVHSESLRLSNYIAIASQPRDATFIEPDDNDYKANIFCFAAFADKHTGVLYSDLTGPFPFMSLEGNVCFLIIYHYKTNAILALHIADFTDDSILAAYIKQFKLLESKGYKIKLNVMDNQACRVIKNYLISKQCNLMLVEPNNHQVNAAERAIQTFKAYFISALATTDSKFPLQLWD